MYKLNFFPFILIFALTYPFVSSAELVKENLIDMAAQQMHVTAIHGGERQIVKSSQIRSDLGLEDYRAVARMIIAVQKSMTEQYSVGDGLTLVSYILKTFADIGDYDLSRDEILAMIAIFEKLTSQPVPPDAMDIIHQIDYLRFSKINGLKTVEIRTIDPLGIKILPEPSEDPSTQDLEIESIKIKNSAKISFVEVLDSSGKQEMIEFLKEAFKLPFLPTSWFKKFNQITPGVSSAIVPYLQEKRDAMPLKLSLSGLVMRVDTQSVLGVENFEFKEIYTTPGLIHLGQTLPSFHLWMKSPTLKVKSSLEY